MERLDMNHLDRVARRVLVCCAVLVVVAVVMWIRR